VADETKNLDIDLDEDLFDFGETALADAFDGEDDADLDEIFAAFQQVQLDSAAEEDEVEEDELEDFFQPEEEVPEPVVQKRPAPQDVWTPERVIAPENGSAARKQSRSRTAREPRQAAATAGLSRSALWALVAVTSVNALVALVTLSGMSTMRSSVVEVGRHVSATADEIRSGAYEQSRVLNDLQTPVVPRDAEEHPTFDRARTEITMGQYSDARRRLYALLSIIDRLDEEQRAKVEARAQFLLAEALHLEALERMEAEQ
jgi:hypothetical protein